jgi:uncharacterized membrane protein
MKLFCLSLRTHAIHLVILVCVIALLRLESIATVVLHCLTWIPGGVYAIRKAAGFYEPLSLLDWMVHFAVMVPNLELVYMLYMLYACSKNYATDSSDSKRGSHVYKTLGLLYAMSHIQGCFTLFSHSAIDRDDSLQMAFLVWDFVLMRIHVFSTGLLLLFPKFGWWTVPCVALGVVFDSLLFESVGGITLSTISILAIIAAPLPRLFQAAWLLLASMPAFLPDSSNDWGHTYAAALLNVPLWLMAYSIYTTDVISSMESGKGFPKAKDSQSKTENEVPKTQ